MAETNQEKQVVEPQKTSDKEMNFRALEAQRKREQEARLEAEKKAAQLEQRLRDLEARSSKDDDDDDEPYVAPKKLDRKLNTFKREIAEDVDRKAEEKAQKLFEKKEQEKWLEDHPDFEEVLGQAERFAQDHPGLAKSILCVPDVFERQRLAYENIKTLTSLKKKEESSIQAKIDEKRRGPYYQPTSVNSGPYASMGDFSPVGQKSAYDKMQELKSRLRM